MTAIIKTLVKDYSWIHLSIGVSGNLTFVIGSVFFLPVYERYQTAGVWLFIVGSALMLVGSIGQLLVNIWQAEEKVE